MKRIMKFIFISLIAISSNCAKDVPVPHTAPCSGDNLVISDSLYNKALLPDSCFDSITTNTWVYLDHYYYNLYMLSLNSSNGTYDTIKTIYINNDCISIPIEFGPSSTPFYLIWNGKHIINSLNKIEVGLLLYADYTCNEANADEISGYFKWQLSELKKEIIALYPDIDSIKIIINPQLINKNRKELIYKF